MTRTVSSILLLLAACAQREPFRGPLASIADSLLRAADISCHLSTRNPAYLGGRIAGGCIGTAADTMWAILVTENDTVEVIRRVWGGVAPANPTLRAFGQFRPECGLLVARSLDGRFFATYRLDSIQGGATLVITVPSIGADRMADCRRLP